MTARTASRCLGAAAVGAALSALAAAPAAAATTLGQPAPSGSPAVCATACTYMQRTSAATSASYVVPEGAWTLTSWSARGGASDGIARLRVFRPASGEERYLIVDESPPETVPADGEPSFPASIAVGGGDVLGLTVGSEVPGTYLGDPGDTSWSFSGDPGVGNLVGFDTPFPATPTSDTRVNLAATLEQDTTPPQTTITRKPPNRTRKHLHKYRFASDDSLALFDCKLDGHSYRPCLPPHKVQPKIGRHRFRVRATDAAGNVDPTPAKDRFKIVNG